MEEWASFETNQHRLDLISDNGRTTYLTNCKTGEIFVYRHYSCSLLKNDASELKTISELFGGGYRIAEENRDGELSKPAVVAYGLGPMWLKVQSQANSSAVQLAQTLDYEVYRVEKRKEDKSDSQYRLTFYFRKGFKFLDSVEWDSGAISRPLKSVIVQVRAKTIQMPGNELIGGEIFDIPAGYGCVRSPNFDHPFRVDLGLEFLHSGAPNKALLEVTLSQPSDSTHHSWQTSRYSLSLMRGSMQLNHIVRSYYESLVQYRDPLSGQLKRQRKVWSDSSQSQAAAILYTFDSDSGECRASHAPSAERLRLDFAISTNSRGSRDQPAPVRVSLDLLDWLFNNWDGFHLISEKPSESLPRVLKEATYELRLDQLRLDPKSEPIWPGPVSIVKEVLLLAQFDHQPFGNSNSNSNDIKQLTSYHTKVTIFFYADDLTKVQYKIALNLLENPIIDVLHMQRLLDISDCIADERSEHILVRYPIDQEEMRSSLIAAQNNLLELFCVNLFDSTPIDPLSVNNFEISFDQFDMFIKFKLLDVPLWQSFQMKQGLSLDWGASLYEKPSGSLESCSLACEHYSCLRFAYNPVSKRCQLEIGLEQSLTTRKISKDFALFEAPRLQLHSAWTELDPSEGEKHLRPHELFEILRQFVSYSSDTAADQGDIDERRYMDYEIPLTIKIEQPPLSKERSLQQEFIELRPVSIHSSLDDMNEILNISPAPAPADKQQTGAGGLVFVADRSKLRAEYSILLEDRDYDRRPEGSEEFGASSYDECASDCDDLNCRSFSFCETTKKCVVSHRMHNSSELQRNSKHAFTCTISVLDYLSKFEPFGSAPLPMKAAKVLDDKSERDCAHHCIEDSGINCQAFYFCPASTDKKDGAARCYLEEKHIHDINPIGMNSIVAYQLVTGGAKMPARMGVCSFYSRSYLSQFDQFVGKSLVARESDSKTTATKRLDDLGDLGPDACARACIERSCVAFDTCLDDDPHKLNTDARRRQRCRLTGGSIERSDLTSGRPGCSTFVLSDRSQFSSAAVHDLKLHADYKALDGRSAKEIILDPAQKEASETDIMSGLMQLLSGPSGGASLAGDRDSIVGGSHWLSRLLSILFGLFLGVGCALLWMRKGIDLSEQLSGWTRFGAR